MSMASLANNEVPSWNDFTTSGFPVIGTPGTGGECPTKAQATAAYDLSSADLSSLASNELLTKLILFPTGMFAYGISNPFTYGGGSCTTSPGPLCSNPQVFIVYATTGNVNTLAGKILFYDDSGLVNNNRVIGPGSGCYYTVTFTSGGTKTGGTVSTTKLIEVDSSGIVLSVSDCF